MEGERTHSFLFLMEINSVELPFLLEPKVIKGLNE